MTRKKTATPKIKAEQAPLPLVVAPLSLEEKMKSFKDFFSREKIKSLTETSGSLIQSLFKTDKNPMVVLTKLQQDKLDFIKSGGAALTKPIQGAITGKSLVLTVPINFDIVSFVTVSPLYTSANFNLHYLTEIYNSVINPAHFKHDRSYDVYLNLSVVDVMAIIHGYIISKMLMQDEKRALEFFAIWSEHIASGTYIIHLTGDKNATFNFSMINFAEDGIIYQGKEGPIEVIDPTDFAFLDSNFKVYYSILNLPSHSNYYEPGLLNSYNFAENIPQMATSSFKLVANNGKDYIDRLMENPSIKESGMTREEVIGMIQRDASHILSLKEDLTFKDVTSPLFINHGKFTAKGAFDSKDYSVSFSSQHSKTFKVMLGSSAGLRGSFKVDPVNYVTPSNWKVPYADLIPSTSGTSYFSNSKTAEYLEKSMNSLYLIDPSYCYASFSFSTGAVICLPYSFYTFNNIRYSFSPSITEASLTVAAYAKLSPELIDKNNKLLITPDGVPRISTWERNYSIHSLFWLFSDFLAKDAPSPIAAINEYMLYVTKAIISKEKSLIFTIHDYMIVNAPHETIQDSPLLKKDK